MPEIITTDILFFFDGKPHELDLYAALAERLLSAYPSTTIQVKRTQISFHDGHLYACVSLTPVRRKCDRPERFITVSFGLGGPLDDPRSIAVQVRPGRWTHHVVIGTTGDIDDRLLGWIELSHALAKERKDDSHA